MDPAVPQNKLSRTRPDYRGRFAPSPTGPLHFGSLVAAVGSFLRARERGGAWLVRIEDLDPPREVPGAARRQLEQLAEFGLRSDEPVRYQSRSGELHRAALERLVRERRAFACGCSRKDLPPSGIYPGTCRNGVPDGREPRSIRFRVDDRPVAVVDSRFGETRYRLDRECGDFVIRRADGLIAYQLAVVVDDVESGITEVVRGRDLLDSAPRQQLIHEALGQPVPEWLHLPLVVDVAGRKLSKSGRADPLETLRPAKTLALALTALGHPPPAGVQTLDALWSWARANWCVQRLPRDPFELPRVGTH